MFGEDGNRVSIIYHVWECRPLSGLLVAQIERDKRWPGPARSNSTQISGCYRTNLWALFLAFCRVTPVWSRAWWQQHGASIYWVHTARHTRHQIVISLNVNEQIENWDSEKLRDLSKVTELRLATPGTPSDTQTTFPAQTLIPLPLAPQKLVQSSEWVHCLWVWRKAEENNTHSAALFLINTLALVHTQH